MPDQRKRAAGRPEPKGLGSPSSKKSIEMKDKPESTTGVFEVARIRELVELMKEHDLSEVDLRESRHRIRICRGPKAVAAPMMMSAPPTAAAPAAAVSASSPVAAAKAAVPEGNFAYVKSPMVGTYYCRPNPKSEPFVKVGDTISKETVVCIIEAMKVFNEIPAEVSGKIVEILVQDGDAVEFEKPLFKIETK